MTDQTGSPVAGAKVNFQGGNILKAASTDSQGRFVFSDVPVTHGTLNVQAKGFATTKINWQNHGQSVSRVRIPLSLGSFAQQVTVTADRTKMLVSQTAGTVRVLSQNDLASTAALSLDGALKQLPGFTLFRRTDSRVSNPTTQGVSLRGVGASGASRALVLENGFPLNDPFGGWVYWDRVPRAAIGRIEVAEGGASNLYGSDAMGGVINIMTRRADHSEVSLDTSYGNESSPDASLWANTVWGRWGAQLGAEAFRTDGYILLPQEERGQVDTAAGSDHTDLNLKLDRQISSGVRAFLSGAVFGESRRNGTPLQTNRTHLRQLRAGADWQSATLGVLSFRGYTEEEIYDQNFSAVAASRNSEALTVLQRVPAQETGYSVEWTRLVGARQTLVAGAEGSAVRGSSNELHYSQGSLNFAAGSGGKQNINGIFGEDIIRLAPRWIFTASARADFWRNFDALSTTRPLAAPGPISVIDFTPRSENAFSPHVSLLHQLTPSVSVYASAYRAFRAPTLNELYRPFRVGNVVTLANSDLGAEHLNGAEIGTALTPVRDRLRVHAAFFWNEITQPIANVTLGTTPSLITRQRQNLGSTRAPGFEIEAESQVRPNLMLSGGYQFVDAKVQRFPADVTLQGLFVPQTPQNTFSVQARYSKPSWFDLGLQGRFTGIQYDDDRNQFPLDRAFTLDFFASHSIHHLAEIYFAAENITGQRYEVARVPYVEVGPPVLARIGLRFNWGAR
ncbi:MAG TPA: TonB-dependent receptor [Terriglobia bacterium]|nr:TonB-dependent receptor [Terriglobia bacterium]